MAKIDIKLEKTEATNNEYDITIDNSTGDLVSDPSFDTDIQYSLFTDGRADESQITQPENRRGWFGDVFSTLDGYQIGSLLWLLAQARLTSDTLSQSASFARNSLQWIIDKGYATRIDASAITENNTGIKLQIDLYVENNLVKSFVYRIWRQSQYA